MREQTLKYSDAVKFIDETHTYQKMYRISIDFHS